jgi:hypothetical protein
MSYPFLPLLDQSSDDDDDDYYANDEEIFGKKSRPPILNPQGEKPRREQKKQCPICKEWVYKLSKHINRHSEEEKIKMGKEKESVSVLYISFYD